MYSSFEDADHANRTFEADWDTEASRVLHLPAPVDSHEYSLHLVQLKTLTVHGPEKGKSRPTLASRVDYKFSEPLLQAAKPPSLGEHRLPS